MEKPNFKRTIRSATTFLCIIICIALSIFVLMRLNGADNYVTVSWITFTPVVLLPAYLVLLFAALNRMRVLGAISLVLVLCHAYWVFPEWKFAEDISAEVAASPSVTLLSHNLLWDNPTPELVGMEISEKNPDFVFLQEFSYRNLDVIRKSPSYDAYPYKFSRPGGGPEGIAIWSKYPLSDTEVIATPGFPQLRAITEVKDKKIVLWNIHLPAPIGDEGTTKWAAAASVLKDRLHKENGAVLVAGDFNATWQHDEYTSLLDKGYKDGHLERGRGYARTWPADGHRKFAPRDGLIRIDHVITNQSLQVTAIEEGLGNGSDHRSIFAKIAIKP